MVGQRLRKLCDILEATSGSRKADRDRLTEVMLDACDREIRRDRMLELPEQYSPGEGAFNNQSKRKRHDVAGAGIQEGLCQRGEVFTPRVVTGPSRSEPRLAA